MPEPTVRAVAQTVAIPARTDRAAPQISGGAAPTARLPSPSTGETAREIAVSSQEARGLLHPSAVRR